MTGRFWRRAHVAAISAISISIVLAVGCSDDSPTSSGGGGGGGTLTIPSSWANTYRVQSTETAPGGRGNVPQIFIDVVCAGTPVTEQFFDSDHDYTCEGTIDANGAAVTCTSEEEIFPGCTETRTATLEATRSTTTGTIMGTITEESVQAGECLRGTGTGTTTDFTAVVLDTDAPGCAAGLDDVVDEAWGGTWEINLELRDCDTGELLDMATFQQLYCPGFPAYSVLDVPKVPVRLPMPRGITIETTGGFSSTQINAFFSEHRENGECQGAQTWRFLLTRTGDSFSGTVETNEYEFAGGTTCTESLVHQCYEVTAIRQSTDTSACTR